MKVKFLSNSELEQSLFDLVTKERKITHLILLHIKEIDVRKLYLDRGRASLFEYLVQDMGYSSSAAQRRIEAARLIKEIPSVAAKIEDGSLKLSQVSEFVRAIRRKGDVPPEEKMHLLEAIENKSTEETQKILAQKLDLALRPPETKRIQKDESVFLQLTLEKDQYEKLQVVRDMAAHRLLKDGKSATMAELIAFLTDEYLKNFTAASAVKEVSKRKEEAIKRITPRKRRQIIERYKCCQYVDPKTKRKCGSRFLLEVDHRVPLWAGGGHEDANLTILCAAHNKHKYRKEAGLRESFFG